MVGLFLYLCVVLSLALIAIRTDAGRKPAFWIFSPWILAFSPIWLGVVDYSMPPIGADVSIFVITHLVIIYIGYNLILSFRGSRAGSGARHSHTGVPLANPDVWRRNEFAVLSRLIDLLVVLGAIGVSLFVIDAFFVSGFASESALEARMNFVSKEATMLGRLAPMLGWGGFVALTAMYWFGSEVLGKRFRWYALCALSVSGFSILSAGRQAIFQLLLLAFVSWILTRKKRFRLDRLPIRKILPLTVAVLIAILLVWNMLALSSERSSTAISDLETYVTSIFGARINPDVETLLRSLPRQLSVGFISGLMYFSSQLSSLAAFLESSAVNTWATGYGAYQFPWIYRRFELFGIPSVLEIMEIRRNYLRTQGFMAVSWSTSLAVFVNDFGFFGSYVYSFIVGLFGGHIYRNYMRKRTFFAFCLIVASYTYLFYMIMFPISNDTIYFFFVLALYLLDRRYVKFANGQVSIRGFRLKLLS